MSARGWNAISSRSPPPLAGPCAGRCRRFTERRPRRIPAKPRAARRDHEILFRPEVWHLRQHRRARQPARRRDIEAPDGSLRSRSPKLHAAVCIQGVPLRLPFPPSGNQGGDNAPYVLTASRALKPRASSVPTQSRVCGDLKGPAPEHDPTVIFIRQHQHGVPSRSLGTEPAGQLRHRDKESVT